MTPIHTADPSGFKPWDILARECLVSGLPFVEVFRETVRLPSGKIVDDYYHVCSPDVTVVVAQTVEKQILLHRIYRHGLRRVSWSLPGGSIEPGEDPLAAARRELVEETGHVSERWVPLYGVFQDGNRRGYLAHMFLALEAREDREVMSQDLEQHEVWLAAWPEALDLAARGEFLEMGAVCALLTAHLHLQREGA